MISKFKSWTPIIGKRKTSIDENSKKSEWVVCDVNKTVTWIEIMNQIQVSVIAKEWIMLLVLSFWFFETKKNLFGSLFACSMKYFPKARILNARPIHVLSYDWLKMNQSNDSIWIPMWKLFFENDGGTFDRLWCSKAADCQQISWCWWTRSRSMESCFC